VIVMLEIKGEILWNEHCGHFTTYMCGQGRG